jgi:hypothetical protein
VKRRNARARARVLTAAAIAALLGIVSVAGGAMAGDTRSIYIGDPDGSGLLEPTITSEGNLTRVRVLAKNTGRQNVTHVALGIGTDAATSINQPGVPSLPDGWTVETLTGDGTCTIEADGLGARCALGSLPARSSARATFVLRTAAAGTFDFWASVKLDENTNDGGANADSFYAIGHLDVDPNDGDHFGTFLGANQGGTFGTGFANLGQTRQGALVTVPGAPDGTPVSVVENGNATTCAASVSCFGALETVNVADGTGVTPFLTWQIHWDASLLPRGFNPVKAGVVHVLDNGKVVVIPIKKNTCSATKTTDCVVGYVLTKEYFELTLQTATNGGMRGWG